MILSVRVGVLVCTCVYVRAHLAGRRIAKEIPEGEEAALATVPERGKHSRGDDASPSRFDLKGKNF